MPDIDQTGIIGGTARLQIKSKFYKPSIKNIPEVGIPGDGLQLQSACSEMESLFLNHLLQKMRSTIEKSDLFGGGQTEELYTSMLDGEIARNLAKAGGIGLAKALQQQLEMARITSAVDAEEHADIENQQPVRATQNGSENASGGSG